MAKKVHRKLEAYDLVFYEVNFILYGAKTQAKVE